MKTLHQLFHILKFQILIYPYRFIVILLYCCMETYQHIPHKNHGSWADIAFNDMGFCLVVYTLPWVFLQLEVLLSEGQRFDSAPYIPTGSSFFLTRALDRNLIQLSGIVLYAVFVIILLLPGITLIGQSMEPLQIIFQSPEDNGAFQRDLLADPHLGAYQFYDNAERIIVAIPHGWDYQIGLMLFQTLFLSLFFLWIFKGLNDPKRWRYLIVVIGVSGVLQLAMFVYAEWKNIFIDNRFFPDDTSFYGDRFMLYAKYHLWLWIGLALAAIFLIQSIIRKYLRPA